MERWAAKPGRPFCREAGCPIAPAPTTWWVASGWRLRPGETGRAPPTWWEWQSGAGLSLQDMSRENRVGVNGLSYAGETMQFIHGRLRIRPNGGKMHLSLQIGIDHYVAGIAEISALWPDATLQAQAIAARSYAVYAMLRRGSEPALGNSRRSACWCHVVNDSRDQVYAGWNKEIAQGGRWADVGAWATAGMVLTHPEEELGVVQAFYSSSSGGATRDSSTIWGPPGGPIWSRCKIRGRSIPRLIPTPSGQRPSLCPNYSTSMSCPTDSMTSSRSIRCPIPGAAPSF